MTTPEHTPQSSVTPDLILQLAIGNMTSKQLFVANEIGWWWEIFSRTQFPSAMTRSSSRISCISAVGDGPSTAAEHRHTAEVFMPAGEERCGASASKAQGERS
jgi:hypothetical protein